MHTFITIHTTEEKTKRTTPSYCIYPRSIALYLHVSKALVTVTTSFKHLDMTTYKSILTVSRKAANAANQENAHISMDDFWTLKLTVNQTA